MSWRHKISKCYKYPIPLYKKDTQNAFHKFIVNFENGPATSNDKDIFHSLGMIIL